MTQPYALYVRGASDIIFNLADELGFEGDMPAMAVSIFEDGPGTMHIQALYETDKEAEQAKRSLRLDDNTEAFIVQLPDEDWVALSQKGLPPVDAGRFWIYGSHDADKIPENVPWPIRIEAGQAFGTGHHGTTKGCLILFDELLKTQTPPEQILDLGCGAGILAIAAAKALNVDIIATDIDDDAVRVCADNAEQNNVGHLISSYQADGFQSEILAGKTFDLIFANILAGPLMGLAPDIANALSAGGHVILSGILDEQAENVAYAFEAQGLNITKGPSLSGWTSLLGYKSIN